MRIFTDRFENQVAIVNGGADGLGKAIASRSGWKGWQLHCLIGILTY